MLRGNGLYVIAAGLSALCLSTASAGERVTLNETVLDCVPEGCFVVRYVPAPKLKHEIGVGADPNSPETQGQPREETNQPEGQSKGYAPLEAPAGEEHADGGEDETETKASNDGFDAIKLATILNAVAALAVAAFTGFLVWFNWGMSSAAKKQATIMENTLRRMEVDSEVQASQFADQLKVATASADAARDLIDTERAWLAVHNLVLRPFSGDYNDTPVTNAMSVEATWLNKGRSPARKADLYVGHAVMPASSQEIPYINITRSQGGIKAGVVGPEMPIFSHRRVITARQLQLLIRRKIKFIFHSRAYYRTIAQPKIERYTEFTCEIYFDGYVRDEQSGEDQPLFQWAMIGPQNDAT